MTTTHPIGCYKTIKELVYEGESFGMLGKELILPIEEGDRLVEEAKVVLVRYLNPADADDAEFIEEALKEESNKYVDPRVEGLTKGKQTDDELADKEQTKTPADADADDDSDADESAPAVHEEMSRQDLEEIAREEGVIDEDIEIAKTKLDLVKTIKKNRKANRA